MERLAIIGAGPKAAAIAAKAKVLRDLGYAVPSITVFERSEVAANWTGFHGYTDGIQPLGTAPEKDVGYPYSYDAWGERSAEVASGMRAFSWSQYLIEDHRFSHWIDAGRPSPTHRQWAEYLKWVFGKAASAVDVRFERVARLSISQDCWVITSQTASNEETTYEADGMLLTGPGTIATPEHAEVPDRVFTSETLSQLFDRERRLGRVRIAVIGAGESSAWTVITLLQRGAGHVDIVSSSGTIHSRVEGFFENRVYSDPGSMNWSGLDPEIREDFIRRTDRGTFSPMALQILARFSNFRVVPGIFLHATAEQDGEKLGLNLVRLEGPSRVPESYDYVVLATGADQITSLTKLLDADARQILARVVGGTLTSEAVQSRIAEDMAVEGMLPRLFLPGLAGMRQGPGFSNLSCLGLLSDRVFARACRVNEFARPQNIDVIRLRRRRAR